MPSAIGDLVVNVGANLRPLQAGLKSGSNIAHGFASEIVKTLAPMAGLGAGAFGLHSVIEAARESSKEQKKLNAVLSATGNAAGFSSKELGEMASGLQKVTNFSDEETKSAMAVLSTFTKIKGTNFTQTIKSAQDMSAVLGTDLQSSVQLLGKALSNPVRGIMTLRKAGISLTEQQQEMIKTMVAAGDSAGAQGVILDAVGARFGGAAEAMASPLTQLTNSINDIEENLGALLLPAIGEIAKGIQEWLAPIQDAEGSFQDMGALFGQIVHNWSDLAGMFWIDMALQVIDWAQQFQEVFPEITATIVALWTGAIAAFDEFLNHTMDGLKEIANYISKSAISAVVGGATFGAVDGGGIADAIVGTEGPHGIADAFTDALKGIEIPKKIGGDMADTLREQKKGIEDSLAARIAGDAKVTTPPPGKDQEEEKKKADKLRNLALAGAEGGSSESFKQILESIRGAQTKDPLLEEAEKQTEALDRIAANTDKTADNTDRDGEDID
jgi:hypothetical protein